VAPVATADARRALTLPVSNIEDAFQVASALAWGADTIVTRNVSDFRRSPVRALSPAAFLKQTAA
ncbi:MAG: PIN domain-containing protein, partial [Burkholderiales bacterium]|nr:PIN domain-containing protein [Burkholderiales bacterium]